MTTSKIPLLPEVSKIDPDLLAEFKYKMGEINQGAKPEWFTFQKVAEEANVHPSTVYNTFSAGRGHFNERVFNIACDMLTTAIEQHNSRVSLYNERLEEIAALEIMEYNQQ